MDDRPFMYHDMTECELLKWALDYTMEPVIATFRAIRDELLCIRPRPNINAPGWIFGHIAVTERIHVGRVLEGLDDIPEPFAVFRARTPTEDALRRAILSKQALIDYWREVRAQTVDYLDRITDADLKEIPPRPLLREDSPNRHNPTREWFVMLIKHQNEHWGQLEIVEKLLAGAR